MMQEAHHLKTTIKQMEASLDGVGRGSREYEDIEITYPLNRCLEALKEKHNSVSKLHRERFEQVKSMLTFVFTTQLKSEHFSNKDV